MVYVVGGGGGQGAHAEVCLARTQKIQRFQGHAGPHFHPDLRGSLPKLRQTRGYQAGKCRGRTYTSNQAALEILQFIHDLYGPVARVVPGRFAPVQ